MQSFEHAGAFLAMLDPAPDTIFHFRTLLGRNGRNYSGTLQQCWNQLCADNAAGKNVFVVVNDGGHKKADITRVRALFVDQDKPDGCDWRNLYGIGRDPHMVVQSSPGKWHAYWLADKFPLDRFKAAQKALAAQWGTDPSVTDPSRVMRLPGFLHMKGQPFLSHLVERTVDLPRYAPEAFPVPAVEALMPMPSGQPVQKLDAVFDRDQILRRIARAQQGERNTIVNNSAYQLGRYIPAVFAYDDCERDLLSAVSIWPDAYEFERTIKAGLQAGMADPKAVFDLPMFQDRQDRQDRHSASVVSAGGLPLSVALPSTPVVNLIRGDQVQPQPINWLWPGYLAEGKFHILAGDPGCGKTTAACSLGAIITKGAQWPDKGHPPVADVLIWSGEDDIANTLIPRFMACGGDRSRVHFIDGTTVNGERQSFDPALHVHLLENALDRLPAIRLLIVDPVVSVVAGDSHKNAEVRRALQPLVDLAARRGIAVLGITHFSKGTGTRSPSERVTGSLAFVALARVVMVAARKESDDGPPVHLLVRSKSNIGPSNGGFEYHLSFPEIAPGVVGSCVHWGDSVDGSAREILGMVENDSDGSRQDAKDWLAEQLAEGPVSSKKLMADAKDVGHSWRTLERAKKDIGAKARKAESGWEWFVKLPMAVGLTKPPLPTP